MLKRTDTYIKLTQKRRTLCATLINIKNIRDRDPSKYAVYITFPFQEGLLQMMRSFRHWGLHILNTQKN